MTLQDWGLDNTDISSIILPSFCSIFEYYGITSYTDSCIYDGTQDVKPIPKDNWNSESHKWFPTWLKIMLIILLGWLLIVWWVIVFFSIKAKLNNNEEELEF